MLPLQECYKILGLQPQASSNEVRQAYLKLVKQWHPDSQENTGNPQAQERFLQIQKAYERLKDHAESGTSAPASNPTPSPSSSPAQTSTSTATHLNPEVIYANASDLGRKGQYQEAIAELSRAIRLDPNFAMAYTYRGHLRSLLGLERQAEADLNKARAIESIGSSIPKTPADIEAMARQYSDSGQRTSPFRGRRSPFKKKKAPPVNIQSTYQRKSLSKRLIWTLVAIGGVIGASFLFTVFSAEQPPKKTTPPPQFPTTES